MNIYDLPIANFGELEDEAALKLILEVRSRRRLHRTAKPVERKTKSEPRASSKSAKTFNTPMGKLTANEIRALLEKLKG